MRSRNGDHASTLWFDGVGSREADLGLELVELVIETEERLGIEIRDEDVADLTTVGQFYHYVIDRLGPGEVTEPVACLSATAFYALRRGWLQEFGLHRQEMRPAATVDLLLPRVDRRSNWQRLGAAIDMDLPYLVRPRWVTVGGVLSFLGLTAAAAVSWDALANTPWSVLLDWAIAWFVFGSLFYSVVIAWLTRPLARAIPPNCRTVRDFVNELARRNYGRLARCGRGWNRDEVWSILVAIIREKLQVPESEITPEARFVEDLGAG